MFSLRTAVIIIIKRGSTLAYDCTMGHLPPPNHGLAPPCFGYSSYASAYRCRKERSVTIRIRQNVFSDRALPRTPLWELTTLLRPPSRLGGDTLLIPNPTRLDFPAFVARHSAPRFGGAHCPQYFSLEPRLIIIKRQLNDLSVREGSRHGKFISSPGEAW